MQRKSASVSIVEVVSAGCNFVFIFGGAEGKDFQLSFDTIELARRFAELKFLLDCIKMILNSQEEKRDNLIL